jgi:hypothetical protein
MKPAQSRVPYGKANTYDVLGGFNLLITTFPASIDLSHATLC